MTYRLWLVGENNSFNICCGEYESHEAALSDRDSQMARQLRACVTTMDAYAMGRASFKIDQCPHSESESESESEPESISWQALYKIVHHINVELANSVARIRPFEGREWGAAYCAQTKYQDLFCYYDKDGGVVRVYSGNTYH